MQNAKFNPEQITYVSFFPTDNNPTTPTFVKEQFIVEDPQKFSQRITTSPGLLLLEQKGKKRSFVQCFWLEPGEPIPVNEPTPEPTQDQEETKDETQVKKPTSKKPTPKKQTV